MIRIYEFFIVIVCLLLVIGCAAPYQAFNHNKTKPLGYTDVKLANDEDNQTRYLLIYHGDGTKEQNYLFWQQRANELCLNGYEVIHHKKDILHSSFKSPVNGVMVTLGRQQPVDRGVIQCQ
jgi:hypothetical protein